MYHKHGAYWLVRKGKWLRLGDNLPQSMLEYARRYPAGESGGMDPLIDRWLSQLEGLADNTVAQYKVAANKIRAAFREFSPGQILPTDVAQWMDHMRDNPNMANRCRSVLKLMMDLAVRHGEASSNPVVSIPPFKEKKRDRYITDSEYAAIRDQAPSWLQLVMDACYLTGQRIGDVLGVKLSDISDEGILFAPQKTQKNGKRILVQMTSELAQLIEDGKRMAQGNVRSIYLLPARGGKKRDYRTVRDSWEKACELAGVADAHLHDLRAKSLTDAEHQGLNAQLLGGHASRQMTERYIRIKKPDVAASPTLGGKRPKSA